MMELQESGNWPSDTLHGKYVCTNHFHDRYLNKMINNRAVDGICTYCGCKGKVCDFHDLTQDIIWKISMYYTDIDNADFPLSSGFYDDEQEVIPGYKRVGAFIVPDENEVFEGIDELVTELDLVTDDDDLNNDIESLFSSDIWVSKDVYEEDQTRHLSILWDKFCKDVTSRKRFTFLATPEFDGADNILDRLNEIVVEQGLCKELPQGTEIFRARKIKELQKSYTFIDITSAP